MLWNISCIVSSRQTQSKSFSHLPGDKTFVWLISLQYFVEVLRDQTHKSFEVCLCQSIPRPNYGFSKPPLSILRSDMFAFNKLYCSPSIIVHSFLSFISLTVLIDSTLSFCMGTLMLIPSAICIQSVLRMIIIDVVLWQYR